MKSVVYSVVTCFLLMVSLAANGTHIRAGEIRAVRLNCNTLTYRITLVMYTNLGSPTGGNAGYGTLSLGTTKIAIGVQQVVVLNQALKIGMVTYTTDFTF